MLGKDNIYGSTLNNMNSYTVSRYCHDYSVKLQEELYGDNNDKYSYVEKYESNTGKFVISSDSDLAKDEEGNIIPQRTVLNVEYYDNVNSSDPAFKTTSYISAYDKESSGKEVTKYYVLRVNNKTNTDLVFSYKASEDFRDQLRNLYNSIIKTPGYENTILGLAGMSDDINSEEIGLFDVSGYSNHLCRGKKNRQK